MCHRMHFLDLQRLYMFWTAGLWTVLYRIYDNHLELIQVSRGHEDCIRDIVHIPELDQVSLVMYINFVSIIQDLVHLDIACPTNW